MHSDLPIKQDEYFNHRRPSLRKRYLMKTSLACTPYSACLWQWMLRFKAASAWWLYRMSEESTFLPLLGRLHRGLTSLLPHQCPRQPEMDPFSILSLRISDCLCLDCVTVMIRSLLAQSVYSTAQFYTVNNHGFMSLLFSCLTKAGYLTIHSHRKNTRGSRLKPFDFLPECLRSKAGSPSKCSSLPQHQGRTPLLPFTFYEQMD